MKVGSRIFAPRPLTTAMTVVVLAGLIYLGHWQLQRAAEKQVLFDQFSRGADATRVIDATTSALPRYQHVEATGHYDGARQILIDNMPNADGRAGYFVITPFLLRDGAWLLVNRGWVPLGASREVLPEVGVSADERTLRGRADHLPAAGIQMGTPAPLTGPFPAVANFPTRIELARLLKESSWSPAAEAVLLDADQPDGYVRQWQAPGFPPVRHIAYAVQWFGLGVALIIIYIVTNFRKAPMNEPRTADQDSRNRKFLVALALLFFAPLAVSFYLYYGPVGWRPASHVNRGDLIDPARPLPEVTLPVATREAERQTKPDFLKGKWTLLYYGSGQCSAACRTDLYNTRQIRIALNRDMDRVQRVFVADGECCDWPFLESEHPDLLTVRAVPEAAPLLALLPSIEGVAPLQAERVYLIDPLGNLMMSYAPNARPKGMLEDLKRLLGLSHVG